MSHDKKKQSTGSWKGNRDKHENLPKEKKEKKRDTDSWVQRGTNNKKKKSGLCFLTTACVEHAGLEDNCRELELMRKLRDSYISNLEFGEFIIQDYYESAEIVLLCINSDKNRSCRLDNLLQEIRLIAQMVESSDFANAYDAYLEMFFREKLYALKANIAVRA